MSGRTIREHNPTRAAGTPENLRALDYYLECWRCCGTPQACGAICQSDPLCAALSAAARAVQDAVTAPDLEGTIR